MVGLEVVHHEVLSHGLTINSELYCSQLDRLQEAIKEKRPELINRKGIVFHHNNARPHTSLMTRQKLRELGWEVLMHRIARTLHRLTTICFDLCRTLLMEKHWPTKELPKITKSFSPINHKSSTRMEL